MGVDGAIVPDVDIVPVVDCGVVDFVSGSVVIDPSPAGGALVIVPVEVDADVSDVVTGDEVEPVVRDCAVPVVREVDFLDIFFLPVRVCIDVPVEVEPIGVVVCAEVEVPDPIDPVWAIAAAGSAIAVAAVISNRVRIVILLLSCA